MVAVDLGGCGSTADAQINLTLPSRSTYWLKVQVENRQIGADARDYLS